MKVKLIENGKVADKKGEIKLSEDKEGNKSHVLYLVNKYQQAAKRQGTTKVKNRSEVKGGGAKPYRQKGTGRARRGTNRSPLRRGGGVVFGPSPRDFAIKLNKKTVKKAIRASLVDNQDKLLLAKGGLDGLDCKSVEGLKKQSGSAGLVIYSLDADVAGVKKIQNVAGLRFANAKNVPISDIYSSDWIILSDQAKSEIEKEFSDGR